MCCMWAASDRCLEPAVLVPFLLFQLHYFQRSFVFPLLMKGASRMPLAIMAMGIVFNVLNGYMQGAWIFYLAPADMYGTGWLSTPCFIGRSALFFFGMALNWHSDYVVRHLRKPGDTRHYLLQKGVYRLRSQPTTSMPAPCQCHLASLPRRIRERGGREEAHFPFPLLETASGCGVSPNVRWDIDRFPAECLSSFLSLDFRTDLERETLWIP